MRGQDEGRTPLDLQVCYIRKVFRSVNRLRGTRRKKIPKEFYKVSLKKKIIIEIT